MPAKIFSLDSSKKFEDQEKIGHNRWHPDIPPVATVKPGDSFRVDCPEWFDGAIVNDDSGSGFRLASSTSIAPPLDPPSPLTPGRRPGREMML